MASDGRYPDSHWFTGSGWRIVQKCTNKAAASELAAFLAELVDADIDHEEACRSFLERVGMALSDQYGRTKRPEFAHAVSMLGDVGLFIKMTSMDEALHARKDDVPPEAAFWTLFPRFLNRGRVAMGYATNNRVEAWDMVSAVSRAIERDGQKTGVFVSILSLPHIKQVKALCEARYPGSKRLPADLAGYINLFDEFAAEPKRLDSEQYGDAAFSSDMAEQYRVVISDTDIRPSISVCFGQLERQNNQMAEVVRVKLDLTDSDENARAYMQSTGMTRHTMDGLYRQALALLRACFQRSAALQYRSQ